MTSLFGIGLWSSVIGDVTGDSGERMRRRGHHFVHPRRRCEETSEVSHRQFDAVEDLGYGASSPSSARPRSDCILRMTV